MSRLGVAVISTKTRQSTKGLGEKMGLPRSNEENPEEIGVYETKYEGN
jgi:hypothetical protein